MTARRFAPWVARTLGTALVAGWLSFPAAAQDHWDTSVLAADAPRDLAGLWVWTSTGAPDGRTLNLALAVRGRRFVPGRAFVFEIESRADFTVSGDIQQALCRFLDDDSVECWVGDPNGEQDYVLGNAAFPNGLVGLEGRVRVFAGLRNDPSFLRVGSATDGTGLAGAGAELVARRADGDRAGCPLRGDPTELRAILADPAALDAFAGADVSMLVLEVDPTLVATGGSLVGVWARLVELP